MAEGQRRTRRRVVRLIIQKLIARLARDFTGRRKGVKGGGEKKRVHASGKAGGSPSFDSIARRGSCVELPEKRLSSLSNLSRTLSPEDYLPVFLPYPVNRDRRGKPEARGSLRSGTKTRPKRSSSLSLSLSDTRAARRDVERERKRGKKRARASRGKVIPWRALEP